jgi:hypothetical protein
LLVVLQQTPLGKGSGVVGDATMLWVGSRAYPNVRTRISRIRYLSLTGSDLEPKAEPRSEDDRDRQEETELKVAQDWIGKRLLFQDEYKINYRRIS